MVYGLGGRGGEARGEGLAGLGFRGIPPCRMLLHRHES